MSAFHSARGAYLERDTSPPQIRHWRRGAPSHTSPANTLLGLLFFSSLSIGADLGRAQPIQAGVGEPLLSPATRGDAPSPPLGWGWRLRPTEPIDLSAHRGHFNGLEQVLELEGEVRLQQGNQQLSCATLTLRLDEGHRPLQLSASGALSLRSGLGELRGDELSIDLQRGTLELRGSVELRRAGVTLQAAKLQLDTRRRQLTLERPRGTIRLNEIPGLFSQSSERRSTIRPIEGERLAEREKLVGSESLPRVEGRPTLREELGVRAGLAAARER